MVHLARLLIRGAAGVDVDTTCAIALYTQVIEEGSDKRQIGLAVSELAALQQTLQSDDAP